MKKIKKIMAMLLAMVMVLGMTVTASAAASSGTDGKFGTNDDTGSVTVAGLKAGDVVNLYQIVEAEYRNNGGAFSNYKVVDSFSTAIEDVNVDANTDKISFTESEIAAASKIVSETTPAMTSAAKETVSDDATQVVLENLKPGSYLVKVTAKDSTVYSPAVVSLYYEISGLNEGNVNFLTSDDAYVKRQEAPTLDKWILEDGRLVKGNTVDTGDTVTYVIKSLIPSYTGSFPVYEIVDILQNLTYVSTTSVEVVKSFRDDTIEGTIEGKEFIADSTKKNLTMNFVGENGYELQQYAGKVLKITYTAKLDDNTKATMFNGSNDNTAYLKYTNDASVNIGEPKETNEAVTHTYTFDISSLLKKTTEDGTTVLGGAEFTLYTDEECETKYTNDNFTGVATSDRDGKLDIKGLDAGTYYLKETRAREGYSLNPMTFKIVIMEGSYDDAGVLGSRTVKLTDGTNAEVELNDNNPYVIKNTKINSLPSTGGIGTTIFTIGGCAIMVAAAGLFFASRRKANK